MLALAITRIGHCHDISGQEISGRLPIPGRFSPRARHVNSYSQLPVNPGRIEQRQDYNHHGLQDRDRDGHGNGRSRRPATPSTVSAFEPSCAAAIRSGLRLMNDQELVDFDVAYLALDAFQPGPDDAYRVYDLAVAQSEVGFDGIL